MTEPDMEVSGIEAPEVVQLDAEGPALIICEHASNWIPPRYGGLGLASAACESHAAWDPGARDISLRLAQMLDSPMVAARISRLVYDCNRAPDDESAMPFRSERIEVPGNRDLDAAGRKERTESVYRPFCAAVENVLGARRSAGRATAVITVHSFAPVWFGVPRKPHIGILHDEDARLADAVLARAAQLPHRVIARNDPYGPADGVTHSLRLHGIARGLANVMIEIRNDLLKEAADRARIASEMVSLLRPALADLNIGALCAEPLVRH